MRRRILFCLLFSAVAACVLAACGGGTTVGGGLSPVATPTTSGSGGTGGSGGSGSGGGTTPTATPSSGTSTTPAPGTSSVPNPAATCGSGGNVSDQPPDCTTSEQTFGLTCSPAFVVSAGGYSSCNMKWIEHINLKGGETIGGAYSPSNQTFYLTNWETGVYAFNASNPAAPTLDSNLAVPIGTLPNAALISSVENEETATNGNVLVLSSTEFNDAIILNVSNPSSMTVASTVAGAPAHTMMCLDNCQWVYGSSPNTFQEGVGLTQPAIMNLSNPSQPVLLSNSWYDVADKTIYYHNLFEINPNLVATASNPVYFLDTTNPAAPAKLFSLPVSAAEPEPGVMGPAQSGHLGHSVKWPRQGQDEFFLGQSEGIYVGRCEQFPHDGRTLYSYDTTGWQTTHNFTMSGAYTLVMGNADQGTNGGVQEVDSNGNPSTIAVGTPEGCSTHWFDINSNFENGGLVAMASFSFGVRLLNVASNGQLQQVGWWVPSGISDTVGVYWVSPRVMYALDFETGGLDVIEYTGPLPDAGPLANLRATPVRSLRR